MKQKVKWGAVPMVVTLVSITVAGCGDGGSGAQSSPQASTPVESTGKHLKLSMMYPLYANPPKKAEAWKLIEDKLNIDLDIQAVPSASYKNKLNATAAANDFADITHWNSFPDPSFNKYAEQGAFYPLDDLIQGTKNLKNIPQQIWDKVQVNGHIYGIPKITVANARAVLIRKDWLDALGLPIPKTLDDFYKTAVAFGTQDPDKNGKADTVGIILNQSLNYHLDPIYMAFDTGNGWRVMEDGTLMNADVTPQKKQALGWLKKLYDAGGIDKDFITIKDNQMWEKLEGGKAGIFMGANVNDYPRFVTNLAKIDPKAELIMINPPVGDTGKTGFPVGIGFGGQFVLPGKIAPDKAKRAIDLLDWEAGPEGYDLVNHGIVGIHSTKNADSTYKVDETKYAEDGIQPLVWMNSLSDPFPGLRLPADPVMAKAVKTNLDAVKELVVRNPAVQFVSPIQAEKNAELTKISQDIAAQIILGKSSTDAFDAYVKDWNAKGGAQLTKEVNEWYKTAKK